MIMDKGDRVFRKTYTSIYDLDYIEVGLLIEAIIVKLRFVQSTSVLLLLPG